MVILLYQIKVYVNSAVVKNQSLKFASDAPYPSFQRRLCRHIKIRLLGKGERRSGMLGGYREAACQRINETLPENLERQPLIVWIQARQLYEDIQF